MATESQLIKLEKVQKVCNNTPDKEIPKALSRGHIGYELALKSIVRTGQWSVVTSILSIGIIVCIALVKWLNPYVMGALLDSDIIIAAIGIGCGVISLGLGYKLWRLNITPQFALFALVFILCFNTVMITGLLPIITAVMAVIALTRYSTFCSWFNGIK